MPTTVKESMSHPLASHLIGGGVVVGCCEIDTSVPCAGLALIPSPREVRPYRSTPHRKQQLNRIWGCLLFFLL